MIEHVELEFALSGSCWKDKTERTAIWIDIETKKIPVAGWHQKTRWQPFMVGIAGMMDPGILFLDVIYGDEKDLVEYLETIEPTELRYAATREFDEMVLRGRFTNARRAHSEKPGCWPNLDKAGFKWSNVRKKLTTPVNRGFDVASRDVPDEWLKGNIDGVVRHCQRDVAEMVLRDPDVVIAKKLRNDLMKIMN